MEVELLIINEEELLKAITKREEEPWTSNARHILGIHAHLPLVQELHLSSLLSLFSTSLLVSLEILVSFLLEIPPSP